MKRFFPFISRSNNADVDQTQEAPQADEAIRTESAPQSGPSISTEESNNLADRVANVNARLGLGMDVIVSDPGLRTPIEDLDPNIVDVVRREYVNLGPCQPYGHKYKRTSFGKSARLRSFHDTWFTNHGDWLEYSVAKDAAFCFCCFLFKQTKAHNFGIESFTTKGFKNWKEGPHVLDVHVGKPDSAHNKSRQCYEPVAIVLKKHMFIFAIIPNFCVTSRNLL